MLNDAVEIIIGNEIPIKTRLEYKVAIPLKVCYAQLQIETEKRKSGAIKINWQFKNSDQLSSADTLKGSKTRRPLKWEGVNRQ
jgi:hypothetical protein